ncbi:MAG TPA: transglutaminase family protein, partial [Pirellulaceae bacterium]
MSIRVALHHRTDYAYDRLVRLAPQLVRLRPAPHCRTPVRSYSLKVEPGEHFVNWQQDPFGNYLARFVFPRPTRTMRIEVDLIAEMTVINPFDFFLESTAELLPFAYEAGVAKELQPFLELAPDTSRVLELVSALRPRKCPTVNFLVDVNQRLQRLIQYDIRLEPGVQSAEETLALGRGSCRDSAWLLVQVLRRLGLAARFVSGYLIQLVPDVKSLDGPAGPEADFTDLHAWTEVYLPGAGWVGLDPTSGLFAGEGHLPLACTPDPSSAAPITGDIEPCVVEFQFHMSVMRVREEPRVTKPYDDAQWSAIEALGDRIDQRLADGDVRLTMGGEPTFVSMDDMEGPEWNVAAVGPDKRRLSEVLIKRLRARFAPGGLLHYGQGKWYPGESLPRWALACYWRKDGVPIWSDETWIADTTLPASLGVLDARRFVDHLAHVLGVQSDWVRPAYEDVAHYVWKEQRLPINVAPGDPKLKDPEERARMVRVFERGLQEPVGFVMPLRRQWQQGRGRWQSGAWPTRSEHLFLLPGDSPIGLRLPLDALPVLESGDSLPWFPPDPLEPKPPLPAAPLYRRQSMVTGSSSSAGAQRVNEQVLERRNPDSEDRGPASPERSARGVMEEGPGT